MNKDYTPEQLQRISDFMDELNEVQYIFLDEDGMQLGVEHFGTPQEAMEHAKTFEEDTVDVCIWIGFVDGREKSYFFMEGLNALSTDVRSNGSEGLSG